MNSFLAVVLEIIKITVPALIVFFTVYHILKQYVAGQLNLEMLKHKNAQRGTVTPARLQAYERLMMLCERIAIPDLILRMNNPKMNSKELQSSIMLAIKQEFDYNLTQQTYVSEKLWEIIGLAKDHVLNTISVYGDKVAPNASSQELINMLYKALEEQEAKPLLTAKRAIKNEVSLLF
jgi:hypothetical protein